MINFRLGFSLLGSALLLGSLSLDGGFLIRLRLNLGLLGSSLGLGSFDELGIFVFVAGWLLRFGLASLLGGRSLNLLLFFFLVLTSLLATTLLGRLLGRGATTVLATSAYECAHC